jgi:hypothetical protein
MAQVRAEAIARVEEDIRHGRVVVRQLTTHQGMAAEKGAPRDHSIHGCSIIHLMVISIFFIGGFAADFCGQVAHVINHYCGPILARIRCAIRHSNSGPVNYDMISFQVAYVAMGALGLMPVRNRTRILLQAN